MKIIEEVTLQLLEGGHCSDCIFKDMIECPALCNVLKCVNRLERPNDGPSGHWVIKKEK